MEPEERTVNFDDYSYDYNEILQKQHRIFGDITYYSEYKIQILKKLCCDIKKAKILEYGCGIGRNLPFLQKAFSDSTIYGFDISKKSLEIAKANNPTVFIIENEHELNALQEFFDLIFIAGVYHHIPPSSRDEVTKLIYKIAKPNAIVVVFEHNPFNPITRHMVNTCIFDKDAILLRKKELIKIFTLNNFKYLKSGYALFLPPRLKKINFIENFMRWLPLGGQYYVQFRKRNF